MIYYVFLKTASENLKNTSITCIRQPVKKLSVLLGNYLFYYLKRRNNNDNFSETIELKKPADCGHLMPHQQQV